METSNFGFSEEKNQNPVKFEKMGRGLGEILRKTGNGFLRKI